MAEQTIGTQDSPVPQAVTYRAEFHPQAWQDDNAVDVDPHGPTEWDCTEQVLEHGDYFQRLTADGMCGDWDDDLDGLLDNDDLLKGDPNAPEWIRQWSGPFDIRVFRVTQPAGAAH